MDDPYICIIGGANVDVAGMSADQIVLGESNPGSVYFSWGGVGRNVAENLTRLGFKTQLITATGEDNFGRRLRNFCLEININIEHSIIVPKAKTARYVCVQNNQGEMLLAVSDTEIYNNITSDFLSQKLSVINSAKACMIDANLTNEALSYLMKNTKVPLFFDTVSFKKAQRSKKIISSFFAIKPNLMEAEIISGIKIKNSASLKEAADKILGLNIKWVFISMGKEGVYYTDGKEEKKIESIPVEVVSNEGAGDSFLAGVIWAYMHSMNIHEAALAGLRASSICLQAKTAVNKDICSKTLKDYCMQNWPPRL